MIRSTTLIGMWRLTQWIFYVISFWDWNLLLQVMWENNTQGTGYVIIVIIFIPLILASQHLFPQRRTLFNIDDRFFTFSNIYFIMKTWFSQIVSCLNPHHQADRNFHHTIAVSDLFIVSLNHWCWAYASNPPVFVFHLITYTRAQ